MPYSIRNGKIQTEGIQFAAAYHCNLRCANCLTISSCTSPRFPSLDSVATSLERLGRALHAREVRILGGEPLLNPELGQLTAIARQSGIGDKVAIFTNGRFLERMDETVWRNLDLLNVSLYPEAPPPARALEQAMAQARATGVQVRIFRRHRFYARVVTTPHPIDFTTTLIFRTCRPAHYDHCHWVHEDRLYRCAMPVFLPEYVRKLGRNDYTPQSDGVPIDDGADLYDHVKSLLLSTDAPDCCRYCLGNFGKRQPHRQLTWEELENPASTPIIRQTHLSCSRMVAHLASHLRHMAVSRLRGGLG